MEQKTTQNSKPVTKPLELNMRAGEFKNDKGENLAFSTFYVILMGVEVRLVPKDGTAKQLLENYFSQA